MKISTKKLDLLNSKKQRPSLDLPKKQVQQQSDKPTSLLLNKSHDVDDVNPQPMDVETPDDSIDVSSKFQKAADAHDDFSNEKTHSVSITKASNLSALKIVTNIEVSSCSSTPSAPTTPNTMNLSDKNISHGGSDPHNLSGASLQAAGLNSSNPSVPHSQRTHTLSSSSSTNFVSNQTIPLEQTDKFIGKDPRLKQTPDSSLQSFDNSEYFKIILERLNGKTAEISFVLPKFTVGEAEKIKSKSSGKVEPKHHGTNSPGVTKSVETKSRILSISETVKKDMSSIPSNKANQKKIQVKFFFTYQL